LALFPRTSNEDRARFCVPFDIFSSSLVNVGFHPSETSSLFERCRSGSKLSLAKLEQALFSPRARLRSAHSREHKRPSSRCVPRFDERVSRPRSAASIPSVEAPMRTFGKVSSYITDPSVVPYDDSTLKRMGKSRAYVRANPYETTYQSVHGNIVNAGMMAQAHSDHRHQACQDSMMWSIANGLTPMSASANIDEVHPRNKTWVTAPKEVAPPLIKRRSKSAGGPSASKGHCKYYQTKYMADTANLRSPYEPKCARPNHSQSCIALTCMGVFPPTETSITELTRSVSRVRY